MQKWFKGRGGHRKHFAKTREGKSIRKFEEKKRVEEGVTIHLRNVELVAGLFSQHTFEHTIIEESMWGKRKDNLDTIAYIIAKAKFW